MSLYHYTNLSGLRGILESGEIWLTLIRYMNDSDELKKGIEFIWAKYDELGREFALSKGIDPKLIIGGENNTTNLDQHIKSMGVFVSSFCSKGDLLSQWRGYGGDEGGYSLEFDEDLLEETVNRVDKYYDSDWVNYEDEISKSYHGVHECYLGECCYDDTENRANALRIAKEFLGSELRRLKEKNPDIDFDNREFPVRDAGVGFKAFTWTDMLKVAALWKNSGFREEHEKRLVVNSNLYWGKREKHDELANHLKFRNKGGLLVPFFAFKLPKGCIKRITVGPHKDQQLAKNSLEIYLRALKYDGILSDVPKVVTSEITFKLT